MNNDIDKAIKNAISNIERIYGIVSTDIQRSIDLAIKALAYDRDQYNKGYQNGYRRGLEEGRLRICYPKDR